MLEDPFNRSIVVDELETQDADGGDLLAWDVRAWAGHSLDRIAIRTEGEQRGGDTERAELQVLWAHAFARWWELVAGARADFEPGPSKDLRRVRSARARAVWLRDRGDGIRGRRRRHDGARASGVRAIDHPPADSAAADRGELVRSGRPRSVPRIGPRDARRPGCGCATSCGARWRRTSGSCASAGSATAPT